MENILDDVPSLNKADTSLVLSVSDLKELQLNTTSSLATLRDRLDALQEDLNKIKSMGMSDSNEQNLDISTRTEELLVGIQNSSLAPEYQVTVQGEAMNPVLPSNEISQSPPISIAALSSALSDLHLKWRELESRVSTLQSLTYRGQSDVARVPALLSQSDRTIVSLRQLNDSLDTYHRKLLDLTAVTAQLEVDVTGLRDVTNAVQGTVGSLNATLTSRMEIELQRIEAKYPQPEAFQELSQDLQLKLQKSESAAEIRSNVLESRLATLTDSVKEKGQLWDQRWAELAAEYTSTTERLQQAVSSLSSDMDEQLEQLSQRQIDETEGLRETVDQQLRVAREELETIQARLANISKSQVDLQAVFQAEITDLEQRILVESARVATSQNDTIRDVAAQAAEGIQNLRLESELRLDSAVSRVREEYLVELTVATTNFESKLREE
eukprot:gene5662-7224_t